MSVEIEKKRSEIKRKSLDTFIFHFLTKPDFQQGWQGSLVAKLKEKKKERKKKEKEENKRKNSQFDKRPSPKQKKASLIY